MSAQALRVVIAVVLLFHGVGHALGVLPAFGLTLGRTHAAGSWLWADSSESQGAASGVRAMGRDASRFCRSRFGTSWLVGSAILVARTCSRVGSSIYADGERLSGGAFRSLFPHKLGAIAVNVAVFVCLLWLRWPPQLLAD